MDNKKLLVLSLGFLIAIYPFNSFSQMAERSDPGSSLNIDKNYLHSVPQREPQPLLQHIKRVNLYVTIEYRKEYPSGLSREYITSLFQKEINYKLPRFAVHVLNDLPEEGCIDAYTPEEKARCPRETVKSFTND